MEPTKKSIRDVIRFINVATPWQHRQKNESKLSYAISRTLKSCRKIAADYEEKLGEININNCNCDEKGTVLTSPQGGFIFKKEELKKQRAEDRALQDSIVDVDVHIATLVPNDLTAFERDAFEGFVISESKEE